MEKKFDVKEKVKEIAGKITADPAKLKKFEKEPVQTVEGLLGVDLPDEALNSVVSGVKAIIGGEKLSGAFDAVKKLF